MRRLLTMGVLVGLLSQSTLAARKPPLVPPRITVQTLAALPSSTPQRFRVTLTIDNQNTEPLTVKAVDFKLKLASEGIVDGESYLGVVVGALEQQNVTLELHSDIISSLSRLQAFTRGPEHTLPYEIYGTVTLDRRPKSKGEVPFRSSGDVPLTTIAER
ncbi:MAG TPA: LEA type 2 family protein [Gammaproteobacteria bacterium]|jgi:LEA14-like dessication related protein|nr:LEA type 2 family protein [Gammaproteobacteria bacterium]